MTTPARGQHAPMTYRREPWLRPAIVAAAVAVALSALALLMFATTYH
jgi:hypothetical protein